MFLRIVFSQFFIAKCFKKSLLFNVLNLSECKLVSCYFLAVTIPSIPFIVNIQLVISCYSYMYFVLFLINVLFSYII